MAVSIPQLPYFGNEIQDRVLESMNGLTHVLVLVTRVQGVFSCANECGSGRIHLLVRREELLARCNQMLVRSGQVSGRVPQPLDRLAKILIHRIEAVYTAGRMAHRAVAASTWTRASCRAASVVRGVTTLVRRPVSPPPAAMSPGVFAASAETCADNFEVAITIHGVPPDTDLFFKIVADVNPATLGDGVYMKARPWAPSSQM